MSAPVNLVADEASFSTKHEPTQMPNAKRPAGQVKWLADVAKVIGALTRLLRTLHDIDLL